MDDCHLGCIKKIRTKTTGSLPGRQSCPHSLDHCGLQMTWLWHLLEAVRRRRRRKESKQAMKEAGDLVFQRVSYMALSCQLCMHG